MTRILTLVSLVFVMTISVIAQDKPMESKKKKGGDPAVEQKLTQMEKDLWEAWKNRQLEPFKKAMAAESMNVGSTGIAGTEEALKMLSGDCKVAGYTVDQPQFLWIDKNSVLMSYHATQDATCGEQKVPPEVWASSIWAKHGNEWKAVFHQETPAAAKKSE